MKILILGFGYCARHFVRIHGHRYHGIMATHRSNAGRDAIIAEHVQPVDVAADHRDEIFHHAVRRADAVLVTAGPSPQGDPFVERIGAAASMAGAAMRVRQIIYLSSIAVYGDHQGGWIDEATPALPASQRGQARVRAEQAWQKWAATIGAQCHIVRLPGIYGPGRSAIDQLRAGTARRVIKPGQVFNRVHVTDIAQAIMRLLEKDSASDIWNVTDDEPAPPQDVIAFAAALLNMPVPPAVDFATAELSPMARSFYGENKRVANMRIKSLAGLTLHYPTYREGLRALAVGASD
ncbi:MAG: SDR family oxidoreductase [Beijerinckiaceae bacterium]